MNVMVSASEYVVSSRLQVDTTNHSSHSCNQKMENSHERTDPALVNRHCCV